MTKAPAEESRVHVCGIRHHGPGSSRSLVKALGSLRPDAILIEGPPEANDLIELAGDPEMNPPTALIVYRDDDPKRAGCYPFARFSPEWQAILYACKHKVICRFIDLPMAVRLAEKPEAGAGDGGRKRVDPLAPLASASGCDDGEQWWDQFVEHRHDGLDQFKAISELMAELRSAAPETGENDLFDQRREAYMRKEIRRALNEGFLRIAVVCGAWHAPALEQKNWPQAKSDVELLKGLPKTKVLAAWAPWTYNRLSRFTGYGAGVDSPGWYDHIWSYQEDVLARWLTQAARLLRSEGLEASSASVIEATRLAEAVAALRDNPNPGLLELEEAARSVFTSGESAPLELIRRKLIVGERLGSVPERTPMVPFARDLLRQQKSLRLPPDPTHAIKVLDLREPNDRARSVLLHRLCVLEIDWGRPVDVTGKGTFKEAWSLEWKPELAIDLIESGVWGSTVAEASAAAAMDHAKKLETLPELAELLETVLRCDLPEALEEVMRALAERSALACDVAQLLSAVPPLAKVLRYGDVRQTDSVMVAAALEGAVGRIAVGLVGACSSLDDSAAEGLFESINHAWSALLTLNNHELIETIRQAFRSLALAQIVHPKLAGRATRILHDSGVLDDAEASLQLGRATSRGNEPAKAAVWIEGFLHQGGELLIHDDAFFGLVDRWLSELSGDDFQGVLPLLRRAFSEFEFPVRRGIGEKVLETAAGAPTPGRGIDSTQKRFDIQRAIEAMEIVAQFIGLNNREHADAAE